MLDLTANPKKKNWLTRTQQDCPIDKFELQGGYHS